MAALNAARRALYISHTGMSEPLGQSQVIPYVRGLSAAGWQIEIVSFEPAGTAPIELARTAEQLAALGIGYHPIRRSPSHALSVKFAEAAQGLARLLLRSVRNRPQIVHARSYLPAAVAHVTAGLLPGARFLFDIRGMIGEEYVDAGHWTKDRLEYRMVKRVERRLLAAAAGIVVLTDRHRNWLRQQPGLVPHQTPIEVIPCCVDLQRFRPDPIGRADARRQLGAGDRLVLVYSGTLGSWYRAEDMARLFSAIRRRRPALFAVYTRSDPAIMHEAFARQGVAADDVQVRPVAPRDMPRFLAAGDAAVSFIQPAFSKAASSPTKVAEYLAVGLPVVMNRGIGDSDILIDREPAVVDAGALQPDQVEVAADRLLALDPRLAAVVARQAAERWFSLDRVGVTRYRELYERLAG